MPVVLDGIQKVGQVGTLVGAAMESAGHHAQSQMLDIFSGPVGVHMGSLIYLIAILGALVTLASGGNYRYAGYLLIGPPLFFFLVNTRAPSAGAEWTFGQRVHDQTLVQRGTRGLMEGDGSAGEVSLFFKGWNMLVSGIVQGLIDLLHLTEKGSDVDFLNKTERYMETFGAEVRDPLLKLFVNMSATNRCRGYFNLLKQINDPNQPEVNRQGAQKVLESHGAKNILFRPAENPEFAQWIQQIFKGKVQVKEQYNCDDLWKLGVDAMKTVEAERLIDLLVKTGLPDGLTEQQAKEKLMWKFGMTVGGADNIKEYQFGGGVDNAQLTIALNELSARLMYKELTKVNPNLEARDLSVDNGVVKLGDRNFDEGTTKALRDLQATDEYQYKGELIIGALTLPYIQGVVLYFLAVTFPFFALFMMIPGRHTAMMLWMGLWLWAKLWDFGFAVVMLIDNMLYALMPHGPIMTEQEVANPGSAFKTLLEFDPTYSVSTYYNLVACCLLAVPVITGMVVHRGGREVMDAVSSTYREFPSKFGTSVAAYKRAIRAQHSLYKARAYEFRTVQDNAWSVSISDQAMNEHYLRANAIRALKSGSKIFQGRGKQLDGVFGAAHIPISSAMLQTATDAALDVLLKNETGQAQTLGALDQQTMAYKTSKESYPLQLAQQAILDRYNMHHFVRNFDAVARAKVDADNAKDYFPTGGAVQPLLNYVNPFRRGK